MSGQTASRMGPGQGEDALHIAPWSLNRIAEAVGGELVGASGKERIRAVSSDTRDIGGGELFVALVGERFDAHEFVEDAFEAGAAAAVVHQRERIGDIDRPLIVVDDTLQALQELGRAVWDDATRAGLRTISLTGSNGKTTVKEMTAALLESFGATYATPGNLNNHIGVPLTLCALPRGTEFLVAEMGANAVGDIAELIEMAPGQTRLITSIGAAHLEGFGGMDGVRRGKSEIFNDARPDDCAVVPYEERKRLDLHQVSGQILTVGSARESDVRLVDYEPRGGHAVASYEVMGTAMRVEMPLPGRHQALNLGTALAALICEGLTPSPEDVQAALDGLSLPAGRWRVERVANVQFVDDAYNANPTSTVASFDAFMQIESDRQRVAVIGEMLELGETAQKQHVEVARRIAQTDGLDALVVVGPYADAMADAASAAARTFPFDDAIGAGQWLAGFASDTDDVLVFLKGSRGARLEDVIEHVREALEDDDTH